MVDFKGLVGNFIIVALIVVSLFSFIIVTQSENSATDALRNNTVFNESFLEILDTISNSTSEAEEKYGIFTKEEPKAGFASIVLFGIVSVGKTFSTITFGLFAAIIKFPLIVLGVPATVYNLILTWLIIILIVGAWLLYKLGG